MGRTYRMHVEMRHLYKVLVGNSEGNKFFSALK
jgi:hypothetical protein